MPTIKELKKHLETHFEDHEIIAYDIWQVEDVTMRAEEMNVEITEEQAVDVIEQMERRKDASIGLNWDVMDAHMDWIIEESK